MVSMKPVRISHIKSKGTGSRMSRKPGKVAVTSNLQTLIKLKNESKSRHGSSQNTRDAYDRSIRQAKEWLQTQCEAEANFETPRGCPKMPSASEEWTLDELSHVFDKVPNRASPAALALFITFRCFEQNVKHGVAEQAHAAFKKYWEEAYVIF
jgi:hypothetical protein